jgi:hypothetical protein
MSSGLIVGLRASMWTHVCMCCMHVCGHMYACVAIYIYIYESCLGLVVFSMSYGARRGVCVLVEYVHACTSVAI